MRKCAYRELIYYSSEKLLTEINQTWEERLEKTQQIHKEREQALEELGISIEKGSVGISTPKKVPHLVNLRFDRFYYQGAYIKRLTTSMQ